MVAAKDNSNVVREAPSDVRSRLPQKADSFAILYNLTSILDRIDTAGLFPKSQPLEVELGTGDGSFLVEYARQHPERNFIAIERLLGRLGKLERKGRQAGLRNLRAIRIESSYFIRFLLPVRCASALHIYFPDPWPKRRHRGHRLINEAFPALARQALVSEGWVFFRTDDPAYFEQIVTVFSNCPLFRRRDTPAELTALTTDFEREFHARRVPTLRVAFQVA